MGGLPYGGSESDFFSGFSVPRNKEIMRVFRDLEIVEQLGSGIPRILEAYSKDVFEIRESFIRVVLPYAKPLTSLRDTLLRSGAEVTAQVTAQVVLFCRQPRTAKEIMAELGLRHWKTFQTNYLRPLLDAGLLEMTIPDKPRSSKQKYRLTDKGREVLEKLGGGASQ